MCGPPLTLTISQPLALPRNRMPSRLSTGPACECHLKRVSLDMQGCLTTSNDLWPLGKAAGDEVLSMAAGVVLATRVKTRGQVLPTGASAPTTGPPSGQSPPWGRNHVGEECQGSPEGGDLCPNLRFNRLRLTSGVDEVAVTAFLLSGLKAVHPFLSGGGWNNQGVEFFQTADRRLLLLRCQCCLVLHPLDPVEEEFVMQEKHFSRYTARAGLARCLQPLANKKKGTF